MAGKGTRKAKPGLADDLNTYRASVAAAARGERLRPDQCVELQLAMRALRLPSFAFRRDVRALAGADTARGYRRAELLVNHPHLFDPEQWLRDRQAERDRAAAGGRGAR